ncbi:MAG: ATPase, T2SS/T4P/T4SS family [Planctomycetota bacterium]|nr:ATPase, T2SS/T4P/T4SS family [Planctomycetota bacterium]
MATKRRKLGEILRSWGRITEQQLAEALKIAEGSRKRIGDVLVDLSFASDTDIAQALATQFEMEYIDLETSDAVDKNNLKLIPTDLIKKYIIIPLSKDNGRLKILIHDPMDLEILDNIRFRMNCEVDCAIAARRQIKEFIDRAFDETKKSVDAAVREMSMDRDKSVDVYKGSIDIKGLSVDKSLDRGKSLDANAREAAAADEGEDSAVIRLVNHIIQAGVEGRASDIHIEPFADRVRLRYRIDGVCHEQERIPKRAQASVVARLKIMAGMKVEEKRVPQDGRIKMIVGGKSVDFRVSACPAYHGESIVLRILRPDSARIGLANLGLRADTMETFNKVIRRPNGIFLVTGPTGSGKTTTLYSALNDLNRPYKKIITAEDPVEYNFKGINQCQVNESIGLKFSIILRAMLRQAPNIVLVGEIRDKEVADVAIQAALTGHLVFSTLHTNDAPSAITRLIDMGLKPFLVASSIQAVLAQRLVRILCPECKEPDPNPEKRYLKLCGFTNEELVGKVIYRAVGCKRCGGAGYKGRRGVYELMLMNSEIRELAFKRAALNQLRAAAAASGMRSLLGDGKLKILDGQTTPEEISRIAQVEGVVDLDEDTQESTASVPEAEAAAEAPAGTTTETATPP